MLDRFLDWVAQLPELAELARAFPDVEIVLDHLGGPICVGPYEGKRAEVMGRWRKLLREVAACPNVALKLGGIGSPMLGYDWQRLARKPDAQTLADTWGDAIRFCIDAFGAMGFGFVEVGTLTPLPQPGNPKPRLFRLAEDEGVINRMGFNNGGVDRLLDNVRRASYRGVLGINIGKNFDTPIERAADDYLHCLRKVYPLANYVTVNVSSPNTANLRQLQESAELGQLLAALKIEQRVLADRHGKYVPLALKIAPDLDDAQLRTIATLAVKYSLDGVIATNTTVGRQGVAGMENAAETGGLSGAPLTERSTAIVRGLHAALGGALPIIGVGGIMTGADAAQKAAAGATLVQLYTGLIYRGPALVAECARALCAVKAP